MGSLFSSKQKTKTNQTQTSSGTMTPTNPSWVTDAVQGATNQAMALGQTDPYQYVAGASPLQSQAFAGASNLGGWQGANQAGQALTLMGALGGPNLAGRQPQSANPLYGGMTTQGVDNSGRSTSLPSANGGVYQNNNGAYTYQAPQVGQTNLGQASQAGTATMNPALLGNAPTGQATTFGGTQLGQAPTGQASQFGGTQLGPAPTGQATSFNAPQIGGMSGYNAPQADISAILAGLGSAPGVTAGTSSAGGAAAGLATAGQVGPTSTAQAQYANQIDPSALIERYMNPYTSQVYDTTMADFDTEAGRARAAQAAQAAAAGAFGGSRYGLREAQTEGELARARASTGANVLNTGFNTSLGAALQDAGLRSQIESLNAQLGTGVSQFNAGESNTNARTQAGFDTQVSMGNASNQTQAGIANANNSTQSSIANAGNQTQASIAQGGFARDYGLAGLDAATRTALANAGLSADALRFGADANNARTMAQGQYDYGAASQNAASQNQFGLANMDLAGQYGLQQGAFNQQTGLANQDAQMQAMLANLGLAGQYGLQQGQFNQQTGLANQDASMQAMLANLGLAGQYGLQQGQFNQQANQFNAANQQQTNLANTGWQNDRALAQGQLDQTAGLANAGFQQSAGQFGAGASNTLDMFNAQQRDSFLARLLAGGGQLGQLGSDAGNQQRGDVGLQGQLGAEQRAIEQAYRTAPLSLLQAQNALTPWSSLGLFQGQNTNGTMNMTGTNTQTSTPSPFSIGMSLASLFSDPALKTDIEPAGSENGHNLYRYRYLWDEPSRPLRTGVMADEVEDTRPDAVSVVNGFRMVDYGALGLAHLVEA